MYLYLKVFFVKFLLLLFLKTAVVFSVFYNLIYEVLWYQM